MLPATKLGSYELHHLRVLEDGSITTREDEHEIRFRFHHLGFAFTGTLHTGGADPMLELRGTAGLLPFSIQNSTARQDISDLIHQCREIGGVRLSYRMDNRIQIIGTAPVLRPVTSTHLLTASVAIILGLEPYLQLFAKYLTPLPVATH